MTHTSEYDLIDALKNKIIKLAKDIGLSDIVTTRLDEAIINIRDNDSKCECESCLKDKLSGTGSLPKNPRNTMEMLARCPNPKCDGQLEYQVTSSSDTSVKFELYICDKCKKTFTEEWKCINWTETRSK